MYKLTYLRWIKLIKNESVIMKDSIKANLIIIFIIAIVAFGISSSFAKLTISEDVDSYKLISIENNSFKPNYIDEVPTIIETTNTTNSTNSTYSDNTTYTDNYTGYDNNYGGYSNYTYGDIVTTTDYSEY